MVMIYERKHLFEAHKFMKQLGKKYGWKCHYCGIDLMHIRYKRHDREVPETSSDWAWPTLDHVRPKAKRGKDELRNLVLACPGCNGEKGSRYSYDEFREVKKKKRKQ